RGRSRRGRSGTAARGGGVQRNSPHDVRIDSGARPPQKKEEELMHDDPLAGLPFPPRMQRQRDYTRQRQMGIGDLLLENRIIFLGTIGSQIVPPIIDDTLANITIQQLLLLQYENRTQEIHFYINSPGGSVTAALAIYDTMQFLECPISTYCVGMAW